MPWLRRLLRRRPTVSDCIRAAIRNSPCEPLRAPEPRVDDSPWVRGSGAPPRAGLVPPVVILDDAQMDAWLEAHYPKVEEA
jgi:hypothetical protein